MKRLVKLNSKNGKFSINVEAHKFLGIALGVDTYKYKEKTKRSYVVMFLCFVIELEIVTKMESITNKK